MSSNKVLKTNQSAKNVAPQKAAKSQPAVKAKQIPLEVEKKSKVAATKDTKPVKLDLVKSAKAPIKSAPEKKQPKKALTGYMYFVMDRNAEVRKTHNCSMIEATARLGALWKTLTDQEKKPYNDKNTADKLRVEAQLKEISTRGYFILPDGQKSCDVHVVQKTDVQPKRAKTAYVFFVAEKVGPLMSAEKLTCGEAMKKVSIIWNALSEADKKPYTDKSDVDKQRKDDQTAEMAKHGYFMIDGAKSCDLE